MRCSALRLLARAAQQQSHEVQVLASCQSMTTGVSPPAARAPAAAAAAAADRPAPFPQALSARLTTAASQSLRSWFSSSRPEARAAKDAPSPPPGEGGAAAGPSQEGAAADSEERQLSPEQLSAELEAKSQELAEAQKQASEGAAAGRRWLLRHGCPLSLSPLAPPSSPAGRLLSCWTCDCVPRRTWRTCGSSHLLHNPPGRCLISRTGGCVPRRTWRTCGSAPRAKSQRPSSLQSRQVSVHSTAQHIIAQHQLPPAPCTGSVCRAAHEGHAHRGTSAAVRTFHPGY
jgi:hypothetical protein